jgi:hypothetical protein
VQGITEHVPRCPLSVGSSGCHSWGTLPVALRHQLPTSLSRLHEGHPERCVRTHKMIVGSPPLEVDQELWGLLSSGPGATC